MKKFAIRSDMEGLFGVVSWDEVIPGRPQYEAACRALHLELGTLVEALLEAGAGAVEIYDEHYFGLNLDVALFPKKTTVIRGKPPYRLNWAGGLDDSFEGLILQGYHAMAGTKDAILPHTYEPDIEAIWINGNLVGEIGVEAAVAGEAGVPLVLYVGDAHGAREAQALVPDVTCVIVKEGMGTERGRCSNWPEIREALVEAAQKVVQNSTSRSLLKFDSPVEMQIQLGEGDYRLLLAEEYPSIFENRSKLVLKGESVTGCWAQYWKIKDEILAKLKSRTQKI